MAAALLIGSWRPSGDGAGDPLPPGDGVARLRDMILGACDVAMPRARLAPNRSTYWWNEEIAELRAASVRARRRWLRSRRGRADPGRTEGYRTLYKEAKKSLGRAINGAKTAAWGELLASLDDDPWGLAYKLVRNKLRKWSPPVSERLEPGLLEGVLDTLFPEPAARDGEEQGSRGGNAPRPEQSQWSDEWAVSEEETMWAVKRMTERHAAPGPDGVPARAMVIAHSVVGPEIRDVLTDCLRNGHFPREWKRANLVLLKKEGKREGLPSSYRPICLLDEMGKLLERIISRRMQEHLAAVGPNLHECQFGFRRGLSTMDAVLRVKEFAQREVGRGRVVMAVSLDISNAFNSLPWDCVEGSLGKYGFPSYMERILSDYLGSRTLAYRDASGSHRLRDVRRGVPQGSVLGPLLWDIGFDCVLSDVALPPGCATICYADDTLVLAAGGSWVEARSRADDALSGVIGAIRSLDLRVAPQKTEAVLMHDGSWGNPPEMAVAVDGTRVPVGGCIRYLGLTLDSRWTFTQHFEGLAPRLEAVTNQCARLMPNLGGPGGGVRRLYATAVGSVALYGAPAWAGEARRSRKILGILRAALRRLATRVVRGYRTISFAGATLLAGIPPWELTAEMFAETFRLSREERSAPGGVTPWRAAAIKIMARRRLYVRWGEWARDRTLAGVQIREAIAPLMVGWVGRRWGQLTFRLTQILSGHGCFGSYLCRIGREETPGCHHCASRDDSAWHTMAECPAWAAQRREMTGILGTEDLSLPNVLREMLRRREAWSAVSRYCEVVLLKKEAAERERRGEGPRDPHQQRGQAARRPHRRGRR